MDLSAACCLLLHLLGDHRAIIVPVNIVCFKSLMEADRDIRAPLHLAFECEDGVHFLVNGVGDIAIARFYLYLATDDASFFTGAVLMIDGGFTAK